MMTITGIYSQRKHDRGVYSDLIYEWEDIFAEKLGIPIYSYKLEKIIRRLFFKPLLLNKLLQKLEGLRNPKSFILVFELYPRSYYSFQVFSNKIPCIIDFDYNVNIEAFYSVYRNCKLILISNLEAYNYLKTHNCPLNIEHLALSISDTYKLKPESGYRKEFDVIVTRPNKLLMEYLKVFENKYQSFEYVIRQWEDTSIYKKNVYISNKRGVIGEYSDRETYLNLLTKAKVALYSTPGFDEDKIRFMNHVTPSLFEFLSAGCRIIARYPKNKETDFFNLEEIAPRINGYDEFEKTLLTYISDSSTEYLKAHEKYLHKVYTSNRVTELHNILMRQTE